MRPPKLYSEDEIKTGHGQKFMRQEIWNAIDMLYPVDASDILDISNQYGVDTEDVINVLQSYKMEKDSGKMEEATQDVKDCLTDYFQQFSSNSVNIKPPLFNVFYKKFSQLYSESDYSENLIKKIFIKLTQDPNQLSMDLSEVRQRIRNILFEALTTSQQDLLTTIQKAHYALVTYSRMAPKDIITPATQEGWKNIKNELGFQLEANQDSEAFPLIQNLEFIFNELVMEHGAIRNSDRQNIPQYIEQAKTFLDTHRI